MHSLLAVTVISLLVCSTQSQNQDACTTPNREAGRCIPINTCTPIVEMVNNAPRPIPAYLANFLQRSVCRAENGQQIICCPTRYLNTTPEVAVTPTPAPTPTTGTLSPTNTQAEDVSNHPKLNLLPINECGRIYENRIAHGNKTGLFELSFMALLRYDTPNGLKFQCGGTIINKRYILTAAHCLTNLGTDSLVGIRIGEHNLTTEIDCEPFAKEMTCAPSYVDLGVEEIILHPTYNTPRFANDVGLVRVNADMNLRQDNVRAICLPHRENARVAELVNITIAGWGFTENSGRTISDSLLKANLPVVPNAVCQQSFRTSVRVTQSQLCARGANGVDSCQGDSGGPMFYAISNGKVLRYTQFGVISAGGMDCGSPTPGIYTRVTHYLKWILDQLKD